MTIWASRSYRCGVELWPVKTLSDSDASRVNLTPIRSSVMELTSILRPWGSFSYNRRVAPVELTTYVVKATVAPIAESYQSDEIKVLDAIIFQRLTM
jgi:hypothetical protein